MGDLSISTLICEEDQALIDAVDDDHKEMLVQLNKSNFLESEDEYVDILVSRESSYQTSPRTSEDSSEVINSWTRLARSDAVQWIMTTRGYFGFSYQTSYLAVTYYDRFLLRRTIDRGKSWGFRLLSIACLSLAAKMEECLVPPLSEYQFEACKFDNNTIQRMELLVLSTLEWRMNPVTPFAYLNHFMSKLQIDNEAGDFLSKSIGFITLTIDGVNTVEHRPSTIAAAAVFAASNQRLNKHLLASKLSIFSSCGSGTLKLEHVFSCYKMMVEESRNCTSVGDNTFLSTRSNKRRRLQLEDSQENLP